MDQALNILYLAAGDKGSSSAARANALRRLGHKVQIINLRECLPRNIWLLRLNNITGYTISQLSVRKLIMARIANQAYDVAWVDSGYLVGPSIMTLLQQHSGYVVNYNLDDPTGTRDGNAWFMFKRTIRHYDLLVTVRRETEAELIQMGARHVLRVWRGYDEVDHAPRAVTDQERKQMGSEIVFVGTWMPERGPFMKSLVQSGVPLAIYGDLWSKSDDWPTLKAVWRGPAVYGDDYAKIIQCSKIALGLLSKGNRDKHTQRTAEIPALGTLFCAERTNEHLELFREGRDAVFWSDAKECARLCSLILANPDQRNNIAAAGKKAVIDRGLGNEAILSGILKEIMKVSRK